MGCDATERMELAQGGCQMGGLERQTTMSWSLMGQK